MDEGYTFTLQGYDVVVNETENSEVFHVQIHEGGAPVYETDVPITLEDEEIILDEVIDHAAKAAIDMYESEKGTLGQGAEPLEIEAKMKRGQAIASPGCYWMESCNYTEWLMQLKGTPYEQQAIVLLEELINLQAPGATNTELDALYKQKSQVEHELDRLNLERLKTADPPKQIVVIEANRTRRVSFSGLDWVEGFLDAFKDHRLEPQAILKVKELIDLEAAIDVASATESGTWDQQDEVRRQMDALLIEKTKSEVDQKLPQSGIEVAPEMANDIADLMEGVSMDAPLEPMVARRRQVAYEEYYPGEHGEGATSNSILDAMARAVYVTSWSSEWEYLWEDYEDEVIEEEAEELGIEVPNFMGAELMSIAPPTEKEAHDLAKKVYDEIERDNNVNLEDFIPPGEDEDFDQFEFGHYLMMEVLGSGVAWSDDHEDHGLKLPWEEGVQVEGLTPLVNVLYEKYGEGREASRKGCRRPVRKRAQDDKKDPFEVEEFGTELGKGHGDLDPAEVPEATRVPFGPGNYIKLKNEVKVPLWGGASRTIPKGTKGFVDSLYDGHGDRFYIRTEEGALFSTDRDNLAKA